MAVIELDFHNKCKNENKKTANQNITVQDHEREFIYKFRQLNKFDQGRVIGKIDYLLACID